MAKTPNSSATAYADGDDLIAFHDANQVGDLCRDDGVRESDAAIPANSVVIAALARASGDVEAACLRGDRYDPADLNALTGVSAEYLKGLVCDLAFWHISKRRWPKATPEEVSGAKEALETLQALREGERIFALAETQEAGLQSLAEREYDPADRSRATNYARRYFGMRARDQQVRSPAED